MHTMIIWTPLWHDGCIRLSGCGCVPLKESLCPFCRETHTKSLRARFPTRPEDEEKRQGPRGVNRREQSTEVEGW